MKKILVLFLALAMILALAACGAAGKGDPTLVRGTVDGLNYQNESLGLGCTLEGDWHVFSDEELAEMSGTTAEIFNDPEKYQKLLESSRQADEAYTAAKEGYYRSQAGLLAAGLTEG